MHPFPRITLLRAGWGFMFAECEVRQLSRTGCAIKALTRDAMRCNQVPKSRNRFKIRPNFAANVLAHGKHRNFRSACDWFQVLTAAHVSVFPKTKATPTETADPPRAVDSRAFSPLGRAAGHPNAPKVSDPLSSRDVQLAEATPVSAHTFIYPAAARALRRGWSDPPRPHPVPAPVGARTRTIPTAQGTLLQCPNSDLMVRV